MKPNQNKPTRKKCPECKIPMLMVELMTHYGADLIIDQCERCGGLWFDVIELFSARKGSAKDLDELNLIVLYNNITLPRGRLHCPIDGKSLAPFSDQRYPEGLHVLQCGLCGGMWLNRGEFHVFEKHREAIRDRCAPEEKREKTPEEKKKDEEFNDVMRQVYEQAMDAGDDQAILQLTEFLAGPKPKMLQGIELREEFEPTLGVAFRSVYDGMSFVHAIKYFTAIIPAVYMPLVSIILILGMIMRRIQHENSKE